MGVVKIAFILSMPNMTGRPGYRTMEMNGGSSAPYLACTPCVPLFSTLFTRGGNRRAFRLPGAGGGSFPLCSGTFARSYFRIPKNHSRGGFFVVVSCQSVSRDVRSIAAGPLRRAEAAEARCAQLEEDVAALRRQLAAIASKVCAQTFTTSESLSVSHNA